MNLTDWSSAGCNATWHQTITRCRKSRSLLGSKAKPNLYVDLQKHLSASFQELSYCSQTALRTWTMSKLHDSDLIQLFIFLVSDSKLHLIIMHSLTLARAQFEGFKCLSISSIRKCGKRPSENHRMTQEYWTSGIPKKRSLSWVQPHARSVAFRRGRTEFPAFSPHFFAKGVLYAWYLPTEVGRARAYQWNTKTNVILK